MRDSAFSFPPLQVVGLEGFFGIISLTIILMYAGAYACIIATPARFPCNALCIPLYFIPALGNGNSSGGGGNSTVIPPNPRLEDSLEALHMMGDNPTILLAIFTNMHVSHTNLPLYSFCFHHAI
jgi:hypothetical protein